MLPNGGKGKDGGKRYEVKRIAPYRAQQRVVSTFFPEGGRVGLLGDAAHCKYHLFLEFPDRLIRERMVCEGTV